MQFALDRVLSVAGADVIDNKVIFLADQIVDPSLSFTSETEDIVDAMNNVVMVMENGRGATFGASTLKSLLHKLVAKLLLVQQKSRSMISLRLAKVV